MQPEQAPSNSRRMCTDKQLELVAVQKVLEFENHSNLVPKRNQTIPQLQWTDLQLGKLLGRGTFASVYKVRFKDDDNDNDNDTHAIKFLHEKTMADRKTFLAGAVDLAIEARILATLEHKHIIQLHGVRAGSFQESLETCDAFLILDLLVQTLREFLQEERNNQVRPKWRYSRHHREALFRRLETIAMGIARGMEYLHSQHVIFRDLKPANVGFDARGTVRIFDLGLAREEHRYMGGRPVGSPRYMAPEVAKCEPYGLSADVYSFGILLWEVCTLMKPYSELNDATEFRQRVVLGGERPPLNEACFGSTRSFRQIKVLLQGCWHESPQCRPSFTTICTELETQLKGNENGGASRRLLPNLTSLLSTRRRGDEGVTRRRLWRRVSRPADKSMTDREEEEEVVFEH